MNLRRLAWLLPALVTASAPAFAQESRDELARRELLTQADAARTAGDHTRALDLANRAGQLRMTPSIRLMLAQEHDSLGHVLDALDHAGRCVRAVEADAALPNRDRILSGCRALVTSLQSRVGTVTVHVPDSAPPGVHVRVQGGEIAQPLWGIPCPVLPGSVLVEASGPGDINFRRQVMVDGGRNTEVTVTLAAAEAATPVRPAPVATTTPAHAVVPAAAVARPAIDVRAAPTVPPRRPGVAPWVVGGVGVLGLGISALFLGLRESAKTSRDALCGAQYCDPTAVGFQSTADSTNLGMWVSFGLGGAALAAGVIWLVAGRPHTETPTRTAWNFGAVPTPGGFTFGLGGNL